ncbi:hypothetical protein [Fischerella thermalis]|uniref:hypothetical protein n=1 Tax=Fischerella thermalis TaxID=372787 RepID=UPI001ABB0504|nr:hypothetical protein [Fischerella thermalis]
MRSHNSEMCIQNLSVKGMEGLSKRITLVTSIYKGDSRLASAIATEDDNNSYLKS